MSFLRILAIVVTYNGRKHIEKCLSPLCPGNSQVSVLVVDNGSTDDTPDFIRERFPGVEIVETGRNLGFGAANNMGFEFALRNGYDYVYLLNQDAWVDPDDIVRMAEMNGAHPEFGIVSPLQVYDGMVRLDMNFSRKLPSDLINDYVLNVPLKSDVYEINRMVQAAHWLVSCKVLKKVGGFSPAFFHYGEDHNYCHRVMYWGYKIGLVPSVRGVHDREGRVEAIEKQVLLLTQRWRYYLSDPRVSDLHGIRKVARSVCSSVLRYRFRLVKPFFSFCQELRQLLRIKKMTCAPGAFLDDALL